MMDKMLAWLEEAQIQRPAAAAQLSELGELYDRKLWHQLTVKLDSFLELPALQQGDFLIQLYRCVPGANACHSGCLLSCQLISAELITDAITLNQPVLLKLERWFFALRIPAASL